MADEVPYGYCHCGCGQRTNVAPYSHGPSGYVKGEPYLYVRGHSARDRKARERKEQERTPTKPCACGCETLIPANQTWVQGHNITKLVGPETSQYKRHRFDVVDTGYVDENGVASPCLLSTLRRQSFGYVQVQRDGKMHLLHRLVYEATYGPIPEGWHVHHKCQQTACQNILHLTALSPAQHKQVHSKLSPEDVEIIRTSTLPLSELAERFDLHPNSVSNIRCGLRWAKE